MNPAQKKEFERFNFWRRYRGEYEFSEQDWKDFPHGTQAFMDTDNHKLYSGDPVLISMKPETPEIPLMNIPLAKLSQTAQRVLKKTFTDSNPDDPDQPLKWRGTKMLGQGVFGRVGLWELENHPPGYDGPSKMAV